MDFKSHMTNYNVPKFQTYKTYNFLVVSTATAWIASPHPKPMCRQRRTPSTPVSNICSRFWILGLLSQKSMLLDSNQKALKLISWPMSNHAMHIHGLSLEHNFRLFGKRIRTPTESKISIQQAQARKTAVAIGPISLEARFGSMVVTVVRHLRNVPPE